MKFIERLRNEFFFVKGNYLILVISWILMDFANELPGPYYGPFVIYDLGATETILGFIGFASIIVLALVQFPGGYLADRFGRRWLISTLTFGVAFTMLFFVFAPSWELILVGAMIQSFCLLYQPALFAMLSDSTPAEKRGMAFSLTTLIGNVATTPAPIVAGIIITYFTRPVGMRIAYGIVFSLYLSAAILRSKLTETIKTEEKIKPRDLLASYPRAIRESIGVWKTVPRSMYFLLIANLTAMFGLSMAQLFFSVYAVEGEKTVLNISQFNWGLVTSALFLAMIFSAIPVGRLIDKVGRKFPLLLSHIILVPSALLFVYGDLQKLFIAMPLFGLGQLLFFSSFASLQTDLIPRENRAKVIGFSQFVGYILAGFGMLAGGILYTISRQFPFLLMLLFLAPSFLIILLFVHEPEKREAG